MTSASLAEFGAQIPTRNGGRPQAGLSPVADPDTLAGHERRLSTFRQRPFPLAASPGAASEPA